jgi:O-acetylhomoserine (thiol)-lyase
MRPRHAIGGLLVDGGTFDWQAAYDKRPMPNCASPTRASTAWSSPRNRRWRRSPCARREGLRDFGAVMSPHNAFAVLQGIETLGLRMDRHVANTRKIIDFLLANPAVESVSYPELPSHPDYALAKTLLPKGAGGVFTFNLRGDRAAGQRFVDSLKIFSHLANVGDAKSLSSTPPPPRISACPTNNWSRPGIT